MRNGAQRIFPRRDTTIQCDGMSYRSADRLRRVCSWDPKRPRLAVYDSHLGGFVRPYIKLSEREASDRYLCCSAFPLSYAVFSFRKKSLSSSSYPLPLFRWRKRSPFFFHATRGPFPLSPTRIWRRWSKPACSAPIPPAHNPSGSRRMTSRWRIRPRGT